MKVKFLYPILFLFPMIASAQDSTVISLAACLQKAKEHHPYFTDKDRYEQERLLKSRNVNTMWLPQLSLNGQATYQSEAIKVDVPIPGVNIKGSPQDQYKVTLDVNQVLYDGGLAKAQRNITSSGVDIELKQNEADIYKVNEQVSSVYFNLLLLQQSRLVYTNTLNDLKEKELKVASGVKNGILMQADWDNLKIEILKTNQMISDLNTSVANYFDLLNILTGDSLKTSTKLTFTDANLSTADSVRRPELMLFELQQKSLDYSKSLSSTQFKPKFYAFTQLGYGRPGLNMLKDEFSPYYIVGLKMQWNFLDWGKSAREKGTYTLQQEMIGSKRESYLRNVDMNAKSERTKIQQLEEAIKTDQEILELRKGITRQAEKRLDQGVITMSDYLSEYNAEVKAGLQLETHKVQLAYSKVNYLVIKGLL